MVSNDDNSTVYTLLEDTPLQSNGLTATTPAIQGTINHYSINGETLITASNLDYNNRLYFTESNIAENGIYIRNVNRVNYDEWKPTTNLLLQPVGTRCYKFGVDADGSRCKSICIQIIHRCFFTDKIIPRAAYLTQ